MQQREVHGEPVTPEETGRLFRELGVISGQIGTVTETIRGHERLDEERHRSLLDSHEGIKNRLDALERETDGKLDEDDLQAITGKHNLEEAKAKAAELEQRLKDGYRESRDEKEKREDLSRHLVAKKLEYRKKLIERIVLMLIAAMLALVTEQIGKHFSGDSTAAKKSPELKLSE